MKRLIIIPSMVLLLVGYTASSCSSSNADKAQNDSIAAAELEAARLDSIRQDSIARRNFTTPDLAFNDLHGDVKKCEINADYIFTYDEEGNWTNTPNWTAEDKKYCPDRTKHTRVTRNKDGYITRIYEECDADYEYEDINWKDGRIKKRFISNYSYDDSGLLIGREDDEDFDYKRWATYCNYEVDAMGNWIKRDVVEKSINTFYNTTYYTKTTETRKITYYKSDGGKSTSIPNNAKQKQSLQDYKSHTQNEERESNGPNSHSTSSSSSSSSNSSYRSFSSPSDVMSYLSGKRFTDGTLVAKIEYNGVYLDGRCVSAAPRISNITSSTATIRASCPYLGGQDLIFYLDADYGTLGMSSGEKLYLSR